jgi:signal transduction histidine kinase
MGGESSSQPTQRLAELGALTRQLVYRLNNPLTVLRSQLAFLEERVEAGEATGQLAAEGADRLAALKDSVRDMERVIGALGDYVRGDGEPGQTDLVQCALLAYAVASVKLRYAAELDLVEPETPAIAWGIDERLQQLFVGVFLSIGSREATYGRIQVRFEQPDPGRIVIILRDARSSDGPNLSVDDEGLDVGAGLAIARHIAQEHGGRLTQARDPDARVTHRLELPLLRD